MMVCTTSAAALLSGAAIATSDGTLIEGALYLPEYQRPYRWAEKQLEGLLDDLRTFFSAEIKPEHDYYLGSVILHQQTCDGTRRLNIIDGQQRLTTLALLAHCLKMSQYVPGLLYAAPESQARIRANLDLLAKRDLPSTIDFERINVTLVITRSEDDAYRFFETQNTGGVRLGGTDIIKAHHLRAVPPSRQDEYATVWEDMGNLSPLVDAIMKNRRWHGLRFTPLASYSERIKVRDEIVEELATTTGKARIDHAYRPVRFTHGADGWSQHLAAGGYAMRQPLNAGINTIHFLRYFHTLRRQLLVDRSDPDLARFHAAYDALIVQADGSAYLRKLYDATLLLYTSQFGIKQLFEASLWLFRAVYSPRLGNENVVRESTVQKFAKDSQLLDWIVGSHSHDELMAFLRSYPCKVDPSNLAETDSGVKVLHARMVQRYFGMPALSAERADVARTFDHAFCAAIKQRTTA